MAKKELKNGKQLVPFGRVKPNPNNPRLIKDDKFKKLVKSLQSFPQMLEKRPIVVDENLVVLGGNMRLKACKEAGLKKIWIDVALDWTEDQKKEFIIKDNLGYGVWDWSELSENWDTDELHDWGMDIFETDIDLDEFLTDEEKAHREGKHSLILHFSEEDLHKVENALQEHKGTKEEVIMQLLGV